MALKESLVHLLEERRIGTLTTMGEDGLFHTTAVWYLYEDGALYVATSANTSKGRNLKRDSRVSICIESREAGKEAGVSASGHAELIEGEEAMPLALRVNGKYLTDEALEHPKIRTAFVDMSDLVIRLRPEHWISWDMETMAEQLFGGEMGDIDEARFFRPVQT